LNLTSQITFKTLNKEYQDILYVKYRQNNTGKTIE